jgi:hypothetical protein
MHARVRRLLLTAAALAAFALTTGTAMASTTLGTTATGLAVTGGSSTDWVEVYSEEDAVIAAEDGPVPASCGGYPHAFGGCDLWGNPGKTLDVDLGEGPDVLELWSMPGEIGQVSVTTAGGDDIVDLTGEGGHPAPVAGVDTGAGDDMIDARNGAPDMIDCGTGADDTVYTDGGGPSLTGCEHVIDDADAAAYITNVAWQESNGLFNHTNRHYLHAVPVSGPSADMRCLTALTGWQACGAGQDVGPAGGFPEELRADVDGADLAEWPAIAVARAANGTIGLIGPTNGALFVFDYTPPPAPYLKSALPTLADGRNVGSWPIGGSATFDRVCSLDGGALRDCAGGWGPVAPGDHVLVARQRDLAGNLSAPLALRWHAQQAGGGPNDPVQAPPHRRAARFAALRQAVALRHNRLAVPMSCTAVAGCLAKTYTLTFKAKGHRIKVTASLHRMIAGRQARLTFRLTRRQAKALRGHAVRGTIAAPGIKAVRVKLRG